jgi:hypothetical protein
MKRSLATVLFGVLAAGAAHAQTTTTTTPTAQVLQTQNVVSPVTQVAGLAPQVIQFVGGDTNFQNLVNGLAFGLPVTLSTGIAPGITQLVTFTPIGGPLTPPQIAQTLESARQVAITNGITAPTAVQLSSILTGGTLATPAGTTPVTGLVGGTAVSTAVATSNTTVSPAAAMQQGQSFNTSDSPFPRGVSDTVTTTPTTRLDTTGTAAAPRIIPGTTAPTTTPATGTAGTAAAGATTPRFGIAPR